MGTVQKLAEKVKEGLQTDQPLPAFIGEAMRN